MKTYLLVLLSSFFCLVAGEVVGFMGLLSVQIGLTGTSIILFIHSQELRKNDERDAMLKKMFKPADEQDQPQGSPLKPMP